MIHIHALVLVLKSLGSHVSLDFIFPIFSTVINVKMTFFVQSTVYPRSLNYMHKMFYTFSILLELHYYMYTLVFKFKTLEPN